MFFCCSETDKFAASSQLSSLSSLKCIFIKHSISWFDLIFYIPFACANLCSSPFIKSLWLCLCFADSTISVTYIFSKFKSSVLFFPIIYRILRCNIHSKQLPHKIFFLMIKIDYSNVLIFYPIKHIISRHKYVSTIWHHIKHFRYFRTLFFIITKSSDCICYTLNNFFCFIRTIFLRYCRF